MPNRDLSDEIRKAIGAHGAWKMKLKSAINTGRIPATPDQVSCHKSCEFGRWLEGSQIHPLVKERKPYQVIHRLHREFHETVGEIMHCAVIGDESGAVSMLSNDYAEKTDKLTRALLKWLREQPTHKELIRSHTES